MEPEPHTSWLRQSPPKESAGGRSGSLPRLQPMSPEQVALIPRCAEYGAIWLAGDPERWGHCYVVDDGLLASRTGDGGSVENAGIQRVVRGGLRDRDDHVAPVAPEITHGLVRQERVIPENDEAEIGAAARLDVDVVSIDHLREWYPLS
jgi:hypothetical protein